MRISDWSSDVCSSDLREQWKKYQGRLDPKRLVFIDETWAKTNMAPLRGWAPRGRRLNAKVPYGHWRTMTFLAALRCDRIDAPCVLDQPVNGQSFIAYVEQCLLPTRSEEHTSELQSLMRISYAVFCLKKKIYNRPTSRNT